MFAELNISPVKRTSLQGLISCRVAGRHCWRPAL